MSNVKSQKKLSNYNSVIDRKNVSLSGSPFLEAFAALRA